MFSPPCRGCGQSIEVRLKNGGYEVGYSYFGGSLHFESMQRVSIKGMKIAAFDPDNLDVTIGNRQWHFGIRRPSPFARPLCSFRAGFCCRQTDR